MTSPMRQYRRLAHPVHTMNVEIAAVLAGDPSFAALVPGGIHTEPIRLDQPDDYPDMFVREFPGAPSDGFRTNVAVIALQRTIAPGGEAANAVVLYTRLEVRGPRGTAGREAIAAVWRALDGLHRRRIAVGPYRPLLETLSDYRPPVDDPANDLGLYSWTDVAARIALG